MALGSTQRLTEMITRSISWRCKGGRYVKLVTLPPICAVVMKSEKLNFLEHSGPHKACIFIYIKSFRSHYGPGFDTASNRKEYQEYYLGRKDGRCIKLTTLPTFSAVVVKSVKLNFLEHSGPLQACNGTDLHLPLSLHE